MKKVALSVLGILAGYVVVVFVTEFGFRAFPGGLVPKNAGFGLMAFATLIAVTAGFAGGYLAASVAKIRPIVSASIVAVPLVIESVVLLTTRTPPDEFWFDFFGAVTLIGATIAGGLARECRLRRYRAA